MQFTTIDVDNDMKSSLHCAADEKLANDAFLEQPHHVRSKSKYWKLK
jgi:hypothetical protein